MVNNRISTFERHYLQHIILITSMFWIVYTLTQKQNRKKKNCNYHDHHCTISDNDLLITCVTFYKREENNEYIALSLSALPWYQKFRYQFLFPIHIHYSLMPPK